MPHPDCIQTRSPECTASSACAALMHLLRYSSLQDIFNCLRMRIAVACASFLVRLSFPPSSQGRSTVLFTQKARLRGTQNTSPKPALFCSLQEGSAVMVVTQATVRTGTDRWESSADSARPTGGLQICRSLRIGLLFLAIYGFNIFLLPTVPKCCQQALLFSRRRQHEMIVGCLKMRAANREIDRAD